MYINPKWGDGGTCLSCKGTEEEEREDKESANHNSDWGVSTSKKESVDRLVPRYLSNVESGVTMCNSCRLLMPPQASINVGQQSLTTQDASGANPSRQI
jgi:hypothetical protein